MATTLQDQGFSRPVAQGTLVEFPLQQSAVTLLSRLDPQVMVPRRLQQMVNLQRGQLWQTNLAEVGVHLVETFDRIMAAPDLPMPMYQYLAEYSQERFCPGIGAVPPNSLTLLETNPRFIEAFMVGLNYEMNRELLWRGYPGDQRATPFRYFWDWLDDQPDIQPIHRWPKGNSLGGNTRGAGSGGQIVLLVRGELLRRYPNSVILAWKATPDEESLVESPTADQIRQPVFQGRLKPDVTFAGFNLRDRDLETGGGWFFVIQEQPTEPRFGLDVGRPGQTPPLSDWNQATWEHAGVNPGEYLRLAEAGALRGLQLDGLRFSENSAHMASIMLQQPMRVAIHAKRLLA